MSDDFSWLESGVAAGMEQSDIDTSELLAEMIRRGITSIEDDK